VADFRRNGWPDCVGITGRFASDYAPFLKTLPVLAQKSLSGIVDFCMKDIRQAKRKSETPRVESLNKIETRRGKPESGDLR